MTARLLVGPIVGKVTDRTARIVIETERAAPSVVAHARSAHHRASSAPVDVPARTPTVVRFDGLAPDTEYAVELDGVRADVAARVRTLPERPDAMNFVAVSCNFTPRRGPMDLWAVLRDRYVVPGHVHALLHCGDQVYGDSAFLVATRILDGRSTGTRSQQLRILETYRDLYRATWSHPPTRDVLASVSNLAIWDDHEIRDDWGSRPADRDPASADHYIGRLARRVFREYQRQLWDDTDPALPDNGLEGHLHTWGPIGLLFVDQRGPRSFEPDAERPYLGRRQWEWITAALAAGGPLDEVRALVVVTAIPLAYVGSQLATSGERWVVDDLHDHWSYASHRKEQVEMVRALREWKERGGGSREVLVVGGDVHVGGHSDIEHRGGTAYRQLVTSPITNTPPTWFEFQGILAALELEERIGSGYRVEHAGFTRKRNFGVILVRVPDSGTPLIDGTLALED
jgi:phosphodiesterase/alkaline phosphatase D-like protein